MTTHAFATRAPLSPGRFTPLSVGSIRAAGAERDRLLSLRAGLLAQCDALFPEAGRQSCWYGGPLAGGMRAPALLEARLLTGAALGDEELSREALGLCRLVLSSQRPDGNFGCEGESFAARGRMLRALDAAYSLTGDKEILLFFLRYFKYLRDALGASPLSQEDALHTADTLQAGIDFYNITGQKAVLPVLDTLLRQSANYTQLFHAFPYRMSVSRMVSPDDLLRGLATEAEDGYYHSLLRTANGANLCEGLRQSALAGVLTGSGKHLSAPEVGLARMNKGHGAAGGGIAADPLLSGRHPSRGVTSLSVAELAASLEAVLAGPGGESAADQWETLVYNAAAAAFAPDGKSVQSVQQANQAACTEAERFPLLSSDASLFSLSDGDALSALLAVFPRFMRHQWMRAEDGGLAAMGYAPCRVRARLDNASVRILVESDYPADGNVRICISPDQPAAFPLHLRIPAWAKGAAAAVGGDRYEAKEGAFLVINREWHDGDEILLTLPMQTELIPGYHEAVSVARGPLRYVYAPAYDEKTDGRGRTELLARTGFAVALDGTVIPEFTQTAEGPALRARVVPVPSWGLRGASCDQPPIGLPHETEGAFDTLLVPMARARIRLSVLPVL